MLCTILKKSGRGQLSTYVPCAGIAYDTIAITICVTITDKSLAIWITLYGCHLCGSTANLVASYKQDQGIST